MSDESKKIIPVKLVESLILDYIISFSVVSGKKISNLKLFDSQRNKSIFKQFSALDASNQIVVLTYVEAMLDQKEKIVKSIFNPEELFVNNYFLEPFTIEAISDENSNESLRFFLISLGAHAFKTYEEIVDLWDVRARGVEKGFEVDYKRYLQRIRSMFNEEFYDFEKSSRWLTLDSIMENLGMNDRSVKELGKALVSGIIDDKNNYSESIFMFNSQKSLLTSFDYTVADKLSGGFYKTLSQSLASPEDSEKSVFGYELNKFISLVSKDDTSFSRSIHSAVVNSQSANEISSFITGDEFLFNHSIKNAILTQSAQTIQKMSSIYNFYSNYKKNEIGIEDELSKMFSDKRKPLSLKFIEAELFLRQTSNSLSNGVYFSNSQSAKEEEIDCESQFQDILEGLVFSSIEKILKEQSEKK